MRGRRALYDLRARLIDSEADHKAVALAYEVSKDVDASERGILERELELARETPGEARTKLEAIRTPSSEHTHCRRRWRLFRLIARPPP